MENATLLTSDDKLQNYILFGTQILCVCGARSVLLFRFTDLRITSGSGAGDLQIFDRKSSIKAGISPISSPKNSVALDQR